MEAIAQVDDDLCYLGRTAKLKTTDEYLYVEESLALLLKIIPMRCLAKDLSLRPDFLNDKAIQDLKAKVKETKSPYL